MKIEEAFARLARQGQKVIQFLQQKRHIVVLVDVCANLVVSSDGDFHQALTELRAAIKERHHESELEPTSGIGLVPRTRNWPGTPKISGRINFVTAEKSSAFYFRRTNPPRKNGESMRTSARNTFPGTVTKLTRGSVNTEVELTLARGERIVAMITNESAAALGLSMGVKATALIKASWVILGKDLEHARLSTRNIMPGKVDKVQEGAVNSEVVLKLDGGTLLTAIITNASVRSLNLQAGEEAFAAFKASHVILAIE